MSDIQKIGIVGAGQMGNGIAHVCALAGYDVVLSDLSADSLTKARDTIEKNMTRQVSRDMINLDTMQQALDRISYQTGYDGFSDVDLAIEAATEKEAVKLKVFEAICAAVPKTTYLASNTSSISITRLASATDRPEKFIGMHFMNPVPLMQLIELIRGLATDQETYEMALKLAERLGKTVEFVRFPDFSHLSKRSGHPVLRQEYGDRMIAWFDKYLKE